MKKYKAVIAKFLVFVLVLGSLAGAPSMVRATTELVLEWMPVDVSGFNVSSDIYLSRILDVASDLYLGVAVDTFFGAEYFVTSENLIDWHIRSFAGWQLALVDGYYLSTAWSGDSMVVISTDLEDAWYESPWPVGNIDNLRRIGGVLGISSWVDDRTSNFTSVDGTVWQQTADDFVNWDWPWVDSLRDLLHIESLTEPDEWGWTQGPIRTFIYDATGERTLTRIFLDGELVSGYRPVSLFGGAVPSAVSVGNDIFEIGTPIKDYRGRPHIGPQNFVDLIEGEFAFDPADLLLEIIGNNPQGELIHASMQLHSWYAWVNGEQVNISYLATGSEGAMNMTYVVLDDGPLFIIVPLDFLNAVFGTGFTLPTPISYLLSLPRIESLITGMVVEDPAVIAMFPKEEVDEEETEVEVVMIAASLIENLLGVEPMWDHETYTLTVSAENAAGVLVTVEITADSTEALINGLEVNIGEFVFLPGVEMWAGMHQDRIMIPLEFIRHAFQVDIDW